MGKWWIDKQSEMIYLSLLNTHWLPNWDIDVYMFLNLFQNLRASGVTDIIIDKPNFYCQLLTN